MNYSFLDILSQKRELIWEEIKKYLDRSVVLPSFCAIPRQYLSLANFHKKIISDYPERRGKYFRPTLVLLTAVSLGFPEEKAIKTAAAMQVSEDWILNHDDIEDDSLERRGKPTLHRIYGKELAINAGDGLHLIMWRILKDNLRVVGTVKGLKIINEFLTMLDRTVLGQTVELKWTQENKTNLKDEDIFFILESKTAYYTIAGPMRLGAILAGATENQLKLIYQFGGYLGKCFQVKDDLLDLTSDFAGLKKQKGNDVYEGKRTIMLMHLFRTIKGKDKKKLAMIMAKDRRGKTKREAQWVIKKMEEYGSLEYGKKLAEELAIEAEGFFRKELKFLSQKPARDFLKSAIDFVIERTY